MKIFKYSLVVLAALVVMSSCQSGQSGNKEAKSTISTKVVNNPKSAEGEMKPYEMPKITFEETTYDFGKIIQGEKVAYDFHFTNTGKTDLVINKVSTSCGCTVGNYPKESIKPGEEGKIEVVFDSKGKHGFQNKTVTILANTTPNHTMLYLKGVVETPEKN